MLAPPPPIEPRGPEVDPFAGRSPFVADRPVVDLAQMPAAGPPASIEAGQALGGETLDDRPIATRGRWQDEDPAAVAIELDRFSMSAARAEPRIRLSVVPRFASHSHRISAVAVRHWLP